MTEPGDPPERDAQEPSDTVTPPGPGPATPEPTEPTPAPAPLVAWEAPAPAYAPPPGETGIGSYAGGPPPFTTGALLSDAFARYGADPVRFFVVAVAASVLSFLGTITTVPFGASPDTSGVIGLLSFVIGIVSGSTTFALAEGGPGMPFGRVIRRGVERAGWMFLTSLIIGIGAFAIVVIAAIPLVLLGFISPTLALIPALAVVVVLFWVGMRISLALPANVADNLNSIDALKVSWRVTRPSGVWLRILAAGLLLGLLFIPAAMGALAVLLLGMFGGQPLLVLPVSLLFAFVTPLASLLSHAAYRRLVPPFQPSWTEAANGPATAAQTIPPTAAETIPPTPAETPLPTAAETPPPTPAETPPPTPAETPPPTPAATGFLAPAFDGVARALLGLLLALDLAGLAVIPYVVGEFISGRIELPRFPGSPGSPFPGFSGFDPPIATGYVAFGVSADLATCTVDGQNIFFASTQPVAWATLLDDPVDPADEVVVTVLRDGSVVEEIPQQPGSSGCLGSEQARTYGSGVWEVQVRVNGLEAASGTFFVD